MCAGSAIDTWPVAEVVVLFVVELVVAVPNISAAFRATFDGPFAPADQPLSGSWFGGVPDRLRGCYCSVEVTALVTSWVVVCDNDWLACTGTPEAFCTPPA